MKKLKKLLKADIAGCLGGAIPEEDYLQIVRRAGKEDRLLVEGKVASVKFTAEKKRSITSRST